MLFFREIGKINVWIFSNTSSNLATQRSGFREDIIWKSSDSSICTMIAKLQKYLPVVALSKTRVAHLLIRF